jgi:hypothetical protein
MNVGSGELIVLHTGSKNITLLDGHLLQPTTRMRYALEQMKPLDSDFQRTFERYLQLNMHFHVPDLGLAIVATQTGRVGILALTKRRKVVPTKST